MTNPIIEYYPNGNKKFERYYLNGQYHRDPAIGPAFIKYYENGQKEFERYYLNGQYHRDPAIGPADICYNENGIKETQVYGINNKRHNPYGPAIIDYKNNQIIKKGYYINDYLHNPYGPAFINYKYHIYKWSFNGKEYTNEVNQYLYTNNLNYKKMTQIDFNIMWTMIL